MTQVLKIQKSPCYRSENYKTTLVDTPRALLQYQEPTHNFSKKVNIHNLILSDENTHNSIPALVWKLQNHLPPSVHQ
jgi:hypothetical protein